MASQFGMKEILATATLLDVIRDLDAVSCLECDWKECPKNWESLRSLFIRYADRYRRGRPAMGILPATGRRDSPNRLELRKDVADVLSSQTAIRTFDAGPVLSAYGMAIYVGKDLKKPFKMWRQ